MDGSRSSDDKVFLVAGPDVENASRLIRLRQADCS